MKRGLIKNKVRAEERSETTWLKRNRGELQDMQQKEPWRRIFFFTKGE